MWNDYIFATYLSVQIQLVPFQTHPLLGCKLPTHPTRLYGNTDNT